MPIKMLQKVHFYPIEYLYNLRQSIFWKKYTYLENCFSMFAII